MEFIVALKQQARQIIELNDQLNSKTHTWDQENSAPDDGFPDRAGFILYNRDDNNSDIELYTDTFIGENDSTGMVRARLSWTPADDDSLFTIMTLDFSTDRQKTKSVTANKSELTYKTLTELLNDQTTVPKLIHVSLNAGKDVKGSTVGKRYEYDADRIAILTASEQAEFLRTFAEAYDQITSKSVLLK